MPTLTVARASWFSLRAPKHPQKEMINITTPSEMTASATVVVVVVVVVVVLSRENKKIRKLLGIKRLEKLKMNAAI